MPVSIEHILSLDEWTEADRLALRNAVQADPELGLALRRWVDLGSEVRRQWDEIIPSRHALVLMACRDRFESAGLSDDEKALLSDASLRLDAALERHPAVNDILERIRHEAAAFDAAWAASFESVVKTDRGPLRRATSRPAGPLRLVRMALAAAAVIAILVVGRSWFDAGGDGPLTTYVAQTDMQVVALSDGSTVRLAPSASLDVLFDSDSADRRVRLAGDAFFEVEPGTRPFLVETSNAITTVLGTTFGVRASDATDVLLVSGRVSVAASSAPDQAIVLVPGQEGVIEAGSNQPEVRSFSMLEGFDWSGLLVFRNTPMSTVVERLSKEFEIRISVSETLSEAPLTGTFESDRGSKAILDIIASALGATVTEREDGSFHLSV